MIQCMMESFGTREEVKEQKKSWSELKAEVCELRRQLARLSTPIPTSVAFRTLPDGRCRVYFLSTPSNGWENTLFYVDVDNSENQALEKLKWQRIVDPNFFLTATGKFSKEEQLQWERKRLATWGITSYEIHSESGKLVFPAASSLFECTDNGFGNFIMCPSEIRTGTNGAKLNPQICPSNPNVVAYVCNNDIWVTHTASSCTQRLTHVHKGGRSMVDDPISAGIPSYVMQEEFNRFQGFWWQPQCKDNIYRIVYEEVDESDVEIYCFPLSNSNVGEIEEFRFPRAGTPNAKWNLKMVQFQINDLLEISDVCCLELVTPLPTLFPWAEYLVRVGWTPDSEHIWIQLLDRRQKRLALALLAADQFLDVKTNSSSENWRDWTPSVHILYSQSSDIWINVHDILYFFPCSENCSTLSFIWASEETGWRHLYFFTSILKPVVNGITDSEHVDGPHVKKFSGRKIVLTSGEWEVLGKHIWVDSMRELVYFLGFRESPLEKHLYVVSLRKPGKIRLLTKPGHSYSVDINKECTIMVAIYSNIQKLPSCQVFRITHGDYTVDGVVLESAGYLSEPPAATVPMSNPELYTHQISTGELLYAMVFKPHTFSLNKKYPTVVNIYGGPEVQLVSNTFKGMRQLRMHMLAAQGYCVIAIDSRGSQHRGLAFEGHLKGRMGTVELSDQVEVLQWLADSLGFIDMNRVAIHGWSYGGYLSLMALVQYPQIFKIAIAGAPVTCWRLYDTGYTERYMDLPELNLRGYKMGSVLNHVKNFPEEENRLLIIHGLIDENVHFTHTSQFVNAMVKAGKPYQLQIYPNERHSLRNLEASKHYETMLLSFLQNNL